MTVRAASTRASVAVLAVALAILTPGCSSKATLEELRKQREDIAQEHVQWKAEIARWQADDAGVRDWGSRHRAAPGDTAEARELDRELAEHEENMARFREQLDLLDAKMQQSSQSTRDQMTAQAEIWADHLRLKARYAILEAAHKSLMEQHAKLTGADSTGRRL